MRFLRRSLTGLFLLAATLGILAAAGYTLYAAMQDRAARESTPRVARERVFAVNVLPFTPGDVAPVLTSFGELRSARVLDLRAAAGGTVVELADSFVEGGRVNEGQLLLRVDPTDFIAAMDNARTDVTEAEADRLDAIAAVDLARDDLSSAQRQADLRDAALARQRDLVTRGVGTDAAVENAALAAVASEQAVLSRRLALANSETRVTQATNKLSRRGLALEQAARRLAETEVYADFAGTLSNVSVIKGGILTQNAQIAQIVDAGQLEVSFRVSTAQYARLLNDAGQLSTATVSVVLDVSGLALRASGQIVRESAAVGEGQTGRLLFASLAQTSSLRPGDFVRVEITEPMLKNVTLLPASAVNSAGQVLVLGDDDRLEEAAVTLLRRQGDNVLVRAPGLEGREVVAERSPVIGAGIKVRPTRLGDAPEASAAPEMIQLSDERRAALVAYVESNTRMPADARDRILKTLEDDEVPASMIERLEGRMGG